MPAANAEGKLMKVWSDYESRPGGCQRPRAYSNRH